MRIGILSDTHDNLETVENAVSFLEDQVEVVVHCGDMIAPFTAELFDSDFEFHAVRGNNDGEWNLKHTVENFGTFHDGIAVLEFDEVKIAVYHGTDEEIVEGLVNSDYDYVFRGHTHRRTEREMQGTVEINPGGVRLPDQEEKFSVAVLDTETGDTNFRKF